jgi:predicted phage tail protein
MARPTAAESIAALKASFDAFREAHDRDREEAKQQRDELTEAIKKVVNESVTTNARLAALESDMASVKPVTEQVRGWKAQAMGGLYVLGLIGAAMMFFADAIRTKITAIFTGG